MADIFVSYTSADRDWAFWIAKELEKLGHVAHVHEWEIPGGGDIMAWMEERHDTADHVLCIVSTRYLKQPYSALERRAAQWAAATSRRNFVIPVYVEACAAPTLFAHLKRCDLYGLGEEEARARLATFLTPPGKPAGPVPFPVGAEVTNPEPPEVVRKAPVFPGARYALTNVPITVPLHFLGREDVLKDIKTALARGDGRVAITALHGLRGVGKTTLAAAYAERHRGDYRATWWIRAQTESGMRADLVALGVQLAWVAADEKEEPALVAVMEGLRRDGEGILLIFDNAVDASSIRSHLPRGGATQVLVTSNAPNWRGIAAPVAIEVWSDEIGADYLIARTGRYRERDAALALSQALGGLPLAHEQAGAYCERLDVSFAEYLRRFQAAPARLLDDARHAPAEHNYGMTALKSFELAIEQAGRLHSAAEPLIVHAALLAPEPIPLSLFAEAREEFAEPFALALAGDGLDEAVAALRAFALIDREMIPDERNPAITTDCIRLHRLIREVAAMRREGEAREETRRALVRAMAAVYPQEVYKTPGTWPRARRLDAIATALVAPEVMFPKETQERIAGIFQELGAFRQYALGAYREARPMFERALLLRENTLGPEHHETCIALSYLAILLRTQGDLAGAKPLYERVLAIYVRSFGAEHSETASALNNLGNLLRDQGDLEGARPLFERALAIYQKVHGPDHPSTATSLNNLAVVMEAQGDLANARSLYERALAIREKALEPEHPDVAMSLINLADTLRSDGEIAEAVSMFQRALAIYEKVVGSEHPWTKVAARHTTYALNALGRTDEGKALREKYRIEDDAPKGN